MPGSMSGGMHMSASIQPTTAPRLSRIPRLKAEARPRVPTRRMTLTRGCRRFSASLQVWSGESSSTTMTSAESPRCRKTLWIVSTMFSRSLNVASTMETRGSGRLTGIWSALLMRVGSRPAAFQEFLDDLVGLLSRQAEARGEIEAAVPEVVGDGVFPVDIRVARIPVLEYRLPVHRAEEGARLDAFGLEILHDGISPLGEARAELDAEHPVDVLRSGRFEGNLEVFAEAEEREVPARDLSLSPHLLIRLLRLGEADRRLHVRQPVVEPHDAVDEPRRLESLVAQEAELRGERRVADEDHSPFPRRQDLVAVEAETPGVPEGPDLAAGDLRSMRLGTILDDGEGGPSPDFQDGRHVAGMPYMCTAMIARARGVIFSSIFPGSRHHVLPSTSTSTGFAPARRTVFAETIRVKSGMMTSSPGPIPRATSDRWSAAVPLEQATACGIPHHAAKASSKRVM